MTRTRSEGRAGFTLLEVLVAVALSSVAMMALFSMFNAVTDVSSGIIKHEENAYGERALEAILFDDLRSVYADGGIEFAFDGGSTNFLDSDGVLLGFCTSASLNSVGDTPSFSLQRVEYLFEEEDEEARLVRRERSYSGVMGDWDWVEVVVLEGIRSMEVEYLNPLDNSFVSEWKSKRYPKAVKVQIEYVDGRQHEFMIELSLMAAEVK